MKLGLIVLALCISFSAHAGQPEISIPDADIKLIKTTDYVEVSGINLHGQQEDFTIHNAKAIKQFIGFLTAEQYIAVPKSLKPDFKSPSTYKVRFFSNGASVFELQVIADTVLDIPNNSSYYMQNERHADLIMAPLRRLR